jgi:tetratricopeptide (TPR) repeat protein
VFHVQDSRWMMHPSYEPSQAAFAPQTLRHMALSLHQQTWARDLAALLTDTVWPEWEGPEKQSALAWTERALAGREPLGPEAPSPLLPADARRLDEVMALDKQGRVEVAAHQLEPLVQRYPRDERVQVMACYLAVRTAPKLQATRERCESLASRFPTMVQVLQCELSLRSGQLAPARTACRKALAIHEETIQAHFILGWLAANTHAGEEARTHLERVIALEPAHPDAWRMLAEQYRTAGRSRELKELQERYRARFSRELR